MTDEVCKKAKDVVDALCLVTEMLKAVKSTLSSTCKAVDILDSAARVANDSMELLEPQIKLKSFKEFKKRLGDIIRLEDGNLFCCDEIDEMVPADCCTLSMIDQIKELITEGVEDDD